MNHLSALLHAMWPMNLILFWNTCPISQHHLLKRRSSPLRFEMPPLSHTQFPFVRRFISALSVLSHWSTHVPRPRCSNYRGFTFCFNVWWTSTNGPSPFSTLQCFPGYSSKFIFHTNLTINKPHPSKQLQEVRSHQKLPRRYPQWPESSSGPPSAQVTSGDINKKPICGVLFFLPSTWTRSPKNSS